MKTLEDVHNAWLRRQDIDPSDAQTVPFREERRNLIVCDNCEEWVEKRHTTRHRKADTKLTHAVVICNTCKETLEL